MNINKLNAKYYEYHYVYHYNVAVTLAWQSFYEY